MVRAGGPRSNQIRVLAEQALKCCDVAGDDRIHRRLELRDRRMLVVQCFRVRGKLIPAIEMMFGRDDRTRVWCGISAMTDAQSIKRQIAEPRRSRISTQYRFVVA